MKKKILFICKYNRFRSKIAESQLKKIRKNISVRSRGIIQGKMNRNKHELDIPRKFGLNIKKIPKGIKYSDIEWANIIIVTANNVPANLFKSRRIKRNIIQWNIPDVYPTTPIKEIERIVIKTIKKVSSLRL